MPGGSEFRLHQGFGLRPKHLHGAKAPRMSRFSEMLSFFRMHMPKQALRCRGKPAFIIGCRIRPIGLRASARPLEKGLLARTSGVPT